MKSTISQNWELDSIYEGGSRSEALKGKMADLQDKIKGLSDELERSAKDEEKLIGLLRKVQTALETWEEIDDFLVCVYAQDVEDSAVLNLMEKHGAMRAELSVFQAELDRMLASIPEPEWSRFIGREEVEPFSFYLKERRKAAADRLPPEQESLISALSVNGFGGWEQLHDQLLAGLKFPLDGKAGVKEATAGEAYMQAMYAEERTVRQKAAAVMKDVCRANEDLYAAALNRIAGFRLDVYRQRGWNDMLKEMLEQNRIRRESLEAMLEAIRQNRDIIRQFLQRKAELLAIGRISWYDLEAPSFRTQSRIPYEEAAEIITRQFGQFSNTLGEFAQHAFQAQWIEAENRPGKAEGGFCASLPLAGESRIFLTYRETYQDVVTIAHELGHAYHNRVLHGVPAFARKKGTSVAETASTFMENLVLDAAVENAKSDQEKLSLLELKIGAALKYVGTLPGVFDFEQKLYERRKEGLVTAEEIRQLLSESEREVYGDALSEANDHIWMYTSHFYDTATPFYNIPYTIGYLFSNGIYALAKKQREGFAERYDALLRNSGRMTVEELAAEYLGEDATQLSFWEAALQPVRGAVEEYVRLTEHFAAGKN